MYVWACAVRFNVAKDLPPDWLAIQVLPWKHVSSLERKLKQRESRYFLLFISALFLRPFLAKVMSASGGIDYVVGSASFDFFAAEAAPSGSGHPPPVSELSSESPLAPPPAENQAGAAQSGYAIPATVILVTIGALLLLAGGLKLCAFIRQRKKRKNYMYATDNMHVRVEPTSSAMPLNNNNNYTVLQQSGYDYKTCRCPHHDWSTMLPLTDLDSPAKTRPQQPRLRELVRIADVLDHGLQQDERSTDGEKREGEGEGGRDTETTSLSSSKSGDGGERAQRMTVVEVELHSQD